MFEGYLKQSTQVTVTVLMISSSDHIAGKTGLSAGLTIYATKAGAAPAAITPTVAELDATNMPGLYSLVFTTTHTNTLGEFSIRVSGTGADPTDVKWQVTARLNDDLAYPATSGRSMVVDTSGRVDATTVMVGPSGTAAAQTARDLGASVLLSAGTGTGQLDFTSGVVKANAVQLLGTAWLAPAVAGTPDVNAKQFGGAPVTATTSVTIPAASTLATTTGAVGSVTGAVGSVTGAVGSVTAGVTVTTNNDKTGYSLSQTFPTNFSALAITAGGIASADIKKVNGVTVNGDGSATPWGP